MFTFLYFCTDSGVCHLAEDYVTRTASEMHACGMHVMGRFVFGLDHCFPSARGIINHDAS